jgi:hypothetical protein
LDLEMRMTIKAFLLTFGLVIACFGALSLVSSGEALAHPGHHHDSPGAAETIDPAAAATEAASVLSGAMTGEVTRACLMGCCVGAPCSLATLCAESEPVPLFSSAIVLNGLAPSQRSQPAVEPLPEPPRSFV